MEETMTKGFVKKVRYKICSSCSNFVSLSDRDTICVICGERLIDKCPNCREPILYPVARFCPACGERIIHTSIPIFQ